MSNLFLILLILAACDLLMIILQACLNKSVWSGYLLLLPVLLVALVLTR